MNHATRTWTRGAIPSPVSLLLVAEGVLFLAIGVDLFMAFFKNHQRLGITRKSQAFRNIKLPNPERNRTTSNPCPCVPFSRGNTTLECMNHPQTAAWWVDHAIDQGAENQHKHQTKLSQSKWFFGEIHNKKSNLRGPVFLGKNQGKMKKKHRTPRRSFEQLRHWRSPSAHLSPHPPKLLWTGLSPPGQGEMTWHQA